MNLWEIYVSISSWYSHKLPHWKTAFFFRPPAYDTKMAKEAIDSMFYVTWWCDQGERCLNPAVLKELGFPCFPVSFISWYISPSRTLLLAESEMGRVASQSLGKLRVVLYHCHFQSSSWLHVVCLSKFFIALPEEKHPIHLCTSFEVWYGNLFPCQLFFQDPS